MGDQFVYIVGPNRNGPLKVGISANPRDRVRELQVGNPEKLNLYWVYPCGAGAIYERIVHRILGARRLVGEWFSVSVETAVGALWIASNISEGDDANNIPENQIRDWAHHIGLSASGRCDDISVGS